MKNYRRILSVACAISICLSCFVWATDPATPERTPWREVDITDFTDRKDFIPGNYKLLSLVASVIEGCRSVRPDYSSCQFPVVINRKEFKSLDAIESFLNTEAKAGITNKIRTYNIEIRSMSLFRDAEMRVSPEYKQMDARLVADFEAVSKRHKGTGVYVHITADWESLRSKKIEAGDPIVMYLTPNKGRWGVSLLHGLGIQ